MTEIEKHLHEHFSSLNDEDDAVGAAAAQEMADVVDSVPEELEAAFAKVNSVVDNSPAATAGLKAGDLIRSFGYVNYSNHDNLKKLGDCVQGNEGVSPHIQSFAMYFRAVSAVQRTMLKLAVGKHSRQGVSTECRCDAGAPIVADAST